MKNKSNYKRKITVNVIVMFFGFTLQTILGFIVRKVLIDCLGNDVLGYNAVFSNILTILNLTELGVGIAANGFLYKAISENNTQEISAISFVLKKIYRLIIGGIFVLGIIISIFLKQIIPNANDSYIYVYIYYYLSLFATISSYLIAYKKTIIIADQKNYVVTLADSLSYIIISVIQIVLMYVAKSYILYLILNIIKFLLTSLFLKIYYYKNYKHLDIQRNLNIEKEYNSKILKQMKDIFVAKIGGAIFNGTDSIIISVIMGANKAGLLSNYTLITITLQNLLTQIFSSIQASLGNYMYSENNEEKKVEVYNVSFFVAFVLGVIAMEGVIFVLPNFISIFFGKEYIMSNIICIVLGINILLMTLLQVPNQLFTIYKLYKYDKYIISVSAILNIIISTILVKILGVEGVLIGTTITLMIYIISRCYIIKKFVFNHMKYILKIIVYIVLAIILTLIIYKINAFKLADDIINGIIINSISIVIISLIYIFIIFIKSREFKFLLHKFNIGKN